MSLSGYAEYKDSGLSWVGRVPSHWFITKTKYVCEFSTGWTPPTGDSSAYEGKNLWANISDLGPRAVYETAKKISDKAARQAGIDLIPAGALMFSFKLSIGQVSFAGNAMYTNEAIATFRESTRLSLTFAYYAFPLFLVQNAAENIYGAKLLNQELIRGATFALPPVEEQITIASFLDRETAKIDALIAEQERLIDLLVEKRQATISHAVTKGLNPSAPMKDSGVAWMGKVPAHWLLTPLARIALDRCDGPFGSGIKSEHYRDEGALVVRLQNIRAGAFNKGESVYLDKDYFLEELQGHAVVAEDLLIAGLGDDNNLLGRACVAPSELGKALVKADCFRFRLDSERAVPYFVAWQLSSGAAYDAGVLSTGTTRSRIPLSVMASRKVALPPHSEQEVIAKFIASENKKIDTLTAEATRVVVLLRERRSALINAAVTGQIDVRGATPQTLVESPEAIAA